MQDGFISVRQEKTDESLEIPTHSALAASLAACQSGHLLLLPTQLGEGFTAKGFGNWFSAAARKTGLTNCSVHGLRKSAARRLAEAGATLRQIMAITGHKSLKEVDRCPAPPTRSTTPRLQWPKSMQRRENGILSNPCLGWTISRRKILQSLQYYSCVYLRSLRLPVRPSRERRRCNLTTPAMTR